MSDCKSKKCKDCNDEYLQGMLPCVTLPTACTNPNPQPCDELYSAACVTYSGNTVSCAPLLLTPLMTAGDSVQTALYNIANLLCTVANGNGGGGSGGSGVDPGIITALQNCCTTNTTAITSINTQLTTINNTISSIQGAVTILNTNVSTIQGNITSIQGDITTINTQITNLQSCCANSANGVTNNGLNGTTNYVTKWTSANSIGDSQIRDDGTSVGIFIAPNPTWRLYVNGNTLKGGYFSTTRVSTNVDLAIGAHGSSSGVSSQGMNIGVFGQADANALLNVGVYGTATGVVAGINIGMFALASAGTSGNYSIQLRDGTEGTSGWYLRNMTSDGKANWAKINITEVTNGLSSTLLGAPNGIATLDNNSKLTISQMPITVMDYKGTFNPTLPSPVLQDGVGNTGDVYAVTAAGTYTFGAGNTLTLGVGDWVIYNGTKWEKTLGNNVGAGTVTSVGLTTGTTGTDVNVSNSPITTTGSIALNIPTIGVAGVTRGVLSSADWNTFNNKVSTTRTISTTAPLQGGGDLSANRTLSITQATSLANGYLSSSDWTLFNNKIGGSGITNYSAKFSAGSTIAISRLYEDTNSFSIGIGASAFANTVFYVQGVAGQHTGGAFYNHSGGTSDGYGLISASNQTAGNNIGVAARAQGIGAAINVGVKAEAGGAGSNYSIQLIDGTQSTAGRYLRNMTTDGKARWANIQVSEVTGAVSGTGTQDTLTKWANATGLLTDSCVKETSTGTSISVGTAATPVLVTTLSVETTGAHATAASFFNSHSTTNSKKGILVLTSNGTGTHIGIENRVGNTSTPFGINVGIFSSIDITQSTAQSYGAYILNSASNASFDNIGAYISASNSGGGGSYAIQLKDGSETVLGGKYLRDMGDGKARWSTIPMLDSSQIMCSDMFSVITASATTNASTIKAYWAAPCNGTFTDMFASLFVAQVGGSAFTVVIRTAGTLVGTLTFVNGQNTSPIITSTTSFAKGSIYEFYVTQAGDGSARGLLITLNYQRT